MAETEVTMADVARAAGCSQATVSRALRGDARVAAVTSGRVKAAAERLGYRPNPLVRALMVQRRVRGGGRAVANGRIAYVVGIDGKRVFQGRPTWRAVWNGTERRAKALGFEIEVVLLGDLIAGGRNACDVLRARGYHGVVLGGASGEWEDRIGGMDGLPVVGLGTYFAVVRCDRARPNDAQNVVLAYGELERLGCRRIGLVTPARNNDVVGGAWTSGFLEERRKRGAGRQCGVFLGNGNELDVGEFGVWRKREKPDGVIVYRYAIAAGGMKVARLFRTGARRGQESGVDGRLEDVGEAAMDLLAGKVYRNEVGAPASGAVRTLMVDGVWVCKKLKS